MDSPLIENKLKWNAPTSVTFNNDDGKEVGKILIEKDGLEFIGKADKSARVFFDYFLKQIVDNYIKEKLESLN